MVQKRRIAMNDKQLQQAVIDELDWEPSVDASHIGVTASNGVVTLNGHVPTYWKKRAAEKAAERVKGVKAIVEEIEVQLRGEDRWADEPIAERALQRLASNAAVSKDRITLKVEDGWVTPQRRGRLALPEDGRGTRRPQRGWRQGPDQQNLDQAGRSGIRGA